MSEVERWECDCVHINPDWTADIVEAVPATDYDAAQARIAALEAEVANWKRLYDRRGLALARPCIACGHVPAVIKPTSAQRTIRELQGELYSLSQDDGKVERALESAQARIRELEAERDALKAAQDARTDMENAPTYPTEALFWSAALKIWVSDVKHSEWYETGDYTHWMPLPPAPQSGQSGEGKV